ncbi:DNA-binding SARP family transcriptional activator [Kribbella amoyensis]|uniref:DNA-binding SARP family transcriptional activator n=1 Tax=Kribbella amoyensis TaxID=996641 RepID=A0A561B8M2_9ACTN|nr:BTAD domain-containing putative transcriptional regulator [Kribbella amoyensis]TWD75042.1 DNA-binding SARP family transcriptional activator [Kribbella amoyensis]
MRFQVLGPVQVVKGEEVAGPVSDLRRTLLACLLVRANRSVGIDSLAEALWATGRPQRPANSLQVHVSRLRQVLDRPDRLRGVPGGYQLAVGPAEFDAFTFADRQAAARSAVEAGDLRGAVTGFRDALALWRGAPYADVDEAQLVGPEARRLSEARMVAYEELYDAELALGRAREIVPELTELVSAYPLRERIVGRLMLALYRSGRQSRAEVTYRAVRQRLARELRTEPGRELRELFEAIRAEDPSLDAPAPEPVRVVSAAPPKPAQLPPPPGAFFGREQEQSDLDEAVLADGPGSLVVLTGMAGVGKTGLALHYAHQVADRYGDGQLYVDLRGHASGPALDPLEALGQLLRGLGTERVPETVTDATAAYRSQLAGRKFLVLLDNAGTNEQVRPLLPAAAGCLTLVTSRNRLSGLVAREGAERISLGTLDADTARALLIRLVGEQRITAEPDSVAELIEVCAGLPLALRIAAAQLADEPHRTVADYLAELRDQRLTVLALEDDEQSAVGTAFDLSYRHLVPGARRLFRLAGLIPGPDFTIDAIAALTGTTVEEARAGLRVLVNAHLLEDLSAGRYRFHDLLKDYAKQRALTEEPEAERADALNRLYTWYYRGRGAAADLLISWRLEPPCPPLPEVPAVGFDGAGEAVAWLHAEFDNIVAAIRACAVDGPVHWCWHLAVGVVSDMERRGHLNDVLSVLEVVVDAARAAGDQQAIALSLGELQQLDTSAGRPISPERIAEMIAAGEGSGAAAIEGYALYVAGVVQHRNGDSAAGFDSLTKALATQERAGDTTGQALTLLHLGNALFLQGQLSAAVRAYERMVELADDLPSLALAGLMNVSHGRITLGRLDGLDELLARGEQLVEQLHDDARRCAFGYVRGSWYRDTGRLAEALDLLTRSGRRSDELSLPRLQSHTHNELGFCHLAAGDHARARAEFELAAELAGSELLQEYRTHAIRGLAHVDLAEGRLDAAEANARTAIELADGVDRMHEGEALVVLARVLLELGRPEAAIEAGEQALAIQRETEFFLGTARAHHVLGEARADEAHLRKALSMFEEFGSPEAAAVRDSLTTVPVPDGVRMTSKG